MNSRRARHPQYLSVLVARERLARGSWCEAVAPHGGRYGGWRHMVGGARLGVRGCEAGGVRLRPWSIRYSTPAQLDAMAAAAGFTLESRWYDMARTPFDGQSDRHVSVYVRD